MNCTPFAHGLSFLGHPAILMPLASVFAARSEGVSPEVTGAALIAAGGIAAAVTVFAILQVGRGKWVDTDASLREERSQLNLFLAPLLTLAAAWSFWTGQADAISAGLAVAAGLVAVAVLLSGWLKMSLHVGFAVLAASLLWPDLRLVGAGLVLAGLIGWSRVHLARHTLADVLFGAAAGGLAGISFHYLLAFP